MTEYGKSFYVGNAKQTKNEGFVLQLNLNQLWEALKDPEVQERIKVYNSQKTGENKTIDIFIGQLKDETPHRTHYAKIINWDSEQKEEQPQSEGEKEPQGDDLPF